MTPLDLDGRQLRKICYAATAEKIAASREKNCYYRSPGREKSSHVARKKAIQSIVFLLQYWFWRSSKVNDYHLI